MYIRFCQHSPCCTCIVLILPTITFVYADSQMLPTNPICHPQSPNVTHTHHMLPHTPYVVWGNICYPHTPYVTHTPNMLPTHPIRYPHTTYVTYAPQMLIIQSQHSSPLSSVCRSRSIGTVTVSPSELNHYNFLQVNCSVNL